VQRIVRAYDSYGRAQQELPLSIAESVLPEPPRAADKSKLIAKPQ